MAYSIRLPDGTLVRNIPDELSPEEAKARIIKAYPQYAPDSSALRQAADIPVQVGRGAVMGVRMLSDALGADNPVSQALRGAEDYLGDLLSASAKKDQQEIARIMKDAEDKGVLDQVKAGIEALTVAPVDLVSQVLGTAVPTIAAGMAGAAAKLGTVGIGTLQAGTGAAMGAGLTKGNIYEVVKEELMADEVPENVAEERAKAAQNYTGENWDQIILGGTLGGAAALGPLERIFARLPAISPQVAAKNLFTRAGVAGVAEAAPEAAQAFQEQVAQNIALQREGFDVPTFRGAVANATLEGLAGFGIGAPIGALEGKPGATKPPGQQEPTEPAAPPPPTPIVPEGELTPDEEAELQARIAAAPPPPAAGIPVEPTPTPPAPIAPQQVTATPEAVAPQIPPEAAPELEALTAQLGQIQQARMDPTLTPDDPAFLELDQQEAAIQTRIQQLTATPEAVTQPPAQPLAPPVAPVVEPEVIPEEAVVEAPVVTPPQIQGPRFGLSSVLDSPTQPLAPEITPPVIEAAPAVELIARPKDEVQAEINRVRQSMKKAQTAVKKGQLPEAEVTKLQERVIALETELDAAKAGKRKPKYRSAEGNTWIGTGAIPGWLNTKLQQGFDLTDFEIRPELGDKSEVEVELEKPPGFGRPAPATRPPQEYERLSRQIDEAQEETPNLFTVLKGRLTDTDVNDISPEKSFSFLRAGKGKGTELSELVDSDELTAYLPDELQPGAPTFDAGEAAEYIKDLLRQDPATDPEARLSYYTRTVLLKDLRQQLDEIEQELEPEDVNQLIQEIIAEERAAIADIEAGAIEEQERGPAVPPVPTDFALTGQTPEELAELQRREESGEAEAERDRLEAEEAARAAAEAERKIADQKRETFDLAPPPSAPTTRAAAPSGDLFGTAGITEQPTRAPRPVAAEPSPIEKLAAEKEKPSIRKTREVAEGAVVERIELPDNVEIRIVKLKDGYSVYQYDLDSDQIVMGQQRQFRSPAFKNDQDAYRAAEAFASDMFDQVVPKMEGEMKGAMKERLSRGEDVINNKTPNPDIPADQRLVLMSCCATKNKGMGMGPAMDVYTGVFFQTFKNKVKDGAMPNLRILSAKYGFINPDQRIEIYDQVMDKTAADKFMLDDKLVEGFPSNIKDVLIVGSDQYQRVMKAAIEDLIKAGKIDKGASINVTKGGIGEQRAQLGRYLASLPAKKESAAKPTSKEDEVAAQRATLERLLPKEAGEWRLEKITAYAGNWRVSYVTSDGRASNHIPIDAEQLVGTTDREIEATLIERARRNGLRGVAEAISAKKEKLKTTGMSITEIMAETEKVRQQLVEMGVDPDPTYRPKDTSKEDREAKEAKKRKELSRLAGESSRIEKLAKEPIIANTEQRSAAERLARSVNGELLFLDGSRGLGIVFAKDREGNDAYLPIHGGKISRVDVRDFTGLKSTDQAYLKRVRSELVRDAGVRQKRKEDESDWEFMLKGTDDQQKGIRAVAETVGGTPVYFDPDTNVGLVRGYGRLTGKPVYAMTMGDRYSTADVEESTVSVFAPYKAQLIEVKRRLEKEAEQKHKDDPFIKFENGIAMSESIDPAIGGIITEWKSMLGLGGVNVYFSTIEDARRNRDNFTGPHRSIGSGTLDAGEGGSMRRMEDGSYYVLFTKGTSKTAMLEILAHELGHVHEREAYNNAPQELKGKLKEAHAKWVAQRKGKTAREAVDMLRAKTTAQTTSIAPGKEKAEDLRPYWSSFSEWYADQVSRWAVTDEKPVGVVEKFFARLGAALRRFYQTLKGQRFLPDETFVQYLNQVKPTIVEEIPGPVKDPVQIEMSFQMQKDLFGSTTEAKEIEQIMEVKGKKKLPPGRSPELTAAAQAVQAGTMTAEEFNKLVDVYKPIPLYDAPLQPATSEQVFDALDVKKREQVNPQIPNGTKVGLRLDIPAFNRKGVFVVSIHQKRTASAPGKVIGYGSVAKAKNVTFGVGNQLKALEIAAGSAKDALQTIEGEYVNVTPEQAFAEAQRAIKDPSYVQVGIDPTRHAYFYDRRTTLPVVSAEEVIQIGNMILAKNPEFGSKQDFLYNIEGGPIAGDTQAADMSFLERLFAEDKSKRKEERNETMAYYKSIRRKEAAMLKKVREYGSTLELQRQLNNLNEIARELKEDLDLDKQPVYSAENFLRQARAALEGVAPYKEQAISPEVFAVIQAVYMDDPKLLEGLRLSIKPEFSKQDQELRRAFGMKRQTAGTFMPMQRLINLYTGTRGVTNPSTIRHELTHTLEQMMTEKQRQALLNSYLDAIKKAMRKHKDAKSQEFFDLVLEFLNNPTDRAVAKMNDAMPSMDFYQYTSPSEYWAVNAEKLMAQRLGTSWDRFKKAIRKVFEKMKKIFGFDNRFAVHDVFDKIMSGSKERMDRRALVDYIGTSGDSFAFLANIEEDAELVRRYNRADTPMLDHSPMRRMIVNAASFTKDTFKDMAQNPSEALRMMFNTLNRGIMYLRNKNIWFGSGINEADRIRYNGQLKTAEGLATASLALDNMVRGGNIATQVVFLGGIEFNKDTQMYSAVQKDKSMTKVYEAEAKLKERLGEQLGTNIIQGYLEAKRSRSIIDETAAREKIAIPLREAAAELRKEFQAAIQFAQMVNQDPASTDTQIKDADRELRKAFRQYRKSENELKDAEEELKTIKQIRDEKVTMSEAEIEDFISREEAHPELKEILDNFGAVNQNLLRFWKDVGLLNDPRYERLAAIKDYVPWYRIMNDEEDVHSPLQATTRSATNIGKEKLFKSGKPSVINDFVIEEGQDVFKIQPSRINAVKLNGVRLKPDQYESTPNGEVRLKVEYKPNDVLVIETQREIENMIDNMTRNVMRMTMNGLRQYAANRIVSEYATRDSKGQVMTFPKVDREKGRFDYIYNGRRTIVEIQDPLIAEAVLGMETVGMEMWKPLAAAANFTRRTITLSPVFQLKQVFKDAPTAALVTGVKRPDLLMGGVMRDFIGAIRDNDPVATILRNQGIGGFYSPARTPEADVKRRIGIINNNTFDYTMKALDHFGDSSDMAQRIAIYKRVMAETGDESLALYQAANVINFLRHGSGQVAQALVKTVPFLNAYAQSIDVLFNALVGGGLRGKDRAAALKQLAVTGGLLAGTTLLYAMLVGDDDDYMKMDDQSKIRSYMIPGTDVVLPMNTSAAFFFKAIPELIYNKVVNEGTENEVDAKRLRTAMKEAAVDLLLGPTPVPSAVKPVIEISLDYNFFTSRPITPRGMDNLDAYQQYDMRTSDAARLLSGLTGTKENRVLNPMEADHLVRSIFGTAGAMVAWSSNLIGASSEYRPEMGLKDMPITGAFLRPEIPRGREDLFYKLKENTDRKYRTFNRLIERDQTVEAEAYLNRHPNLIAYYDYTSEMDTQLKEINAAIRFIGETQDPSYTPETKRREIQELLNLKQDILEGVEQFRKEAYAD